MHTRYGVNQHYRQGPALLDRVAGYQGVVRYKHQYEPDIEGTYNPEATKVAKKSFFFFASSDGSEESIYKTIMNTKPFAKAHKITIKPSPSAQEESSKNRITKETAPDAKVLTQSLTQPLGNDTSSPELFEHIDILESLLHAQDSITMISCGAGYGRSVAFTNAMIRMLGKSLLTYFTALEPDPKIYRCLVEHMTHNDIACRNMELALSDHEGTEGFLSSAFRQKQNPEIDKKEYFLVKTITLDKLLAEAGYTDIALLDIRHAETSVIPASKLLCQNVRKVHVKIHSAHAGRQVRKRFDELNWINVWDFPDNCRENNDFGTFDFKEGLQTWINPEFF